MATAGSLIQSFRQDLSAHARTPAEAQEFLTAFDRIGNATGTVASILAFSGLTKGLMNITHTHTPKPLSHDIKALDLGGQVKVRGISHDLTPKEGITLMLELKEGMNARDFDRKIRALQDLAERGKLIKAPNPVERNPSITRQYRQNIVKKADKKYRATNPEMLERIKNKISKMDVDHQHELQMMGIDAKQNLSLLDSVTNQEIGRQIRMQIRDVPDGTKIDHIKKGEK